MVTTSRYFIKRSGMFGVTDDVRHVEIRIAEDGSGKLFHHRRDGRITESQLSLGIDFALENVARGDWVEITAEQAAPTFDDKPENAVNAW